MKFFFFFRCETAKQEKLNDNCEATTVVNFTKMPSIMTCRLERFDKEKNMQKTNKKVVFTAALNMTYQQKTIAYKLHSVIGNK